jgi:uncharacterized membrane protein
MRARVVLSVNQHSNVLVVLITVARDHKILAVSAVVVVVVVVVRVALVVITWNDEVHVAINAVVVTVVVGIVVMLFFIHLSNLRRFVR